MIPPQLAGWLSRPAFWDRYFLGDATGRFGDVEWQLPAGGPHRLVLQLVGDVTFVALVIDDRFLGRDGGDEQYPPYPDALRCAEVELLARAIALTDATIEHPGAVVALLSKFAPITTDAEAARWLPTLAAAFGALGVAVPAQRYRFWDGGVVSAFDVRSSKFRWIERPVGSQRYILESAAKRLPEVSVASLRVERRARVFRGIDPDTAVDHYPELDGTNFPHELLATTLAAARAICIDAVPRRDERIVELAYQCLRGERGAVEVLGDALDGVANPALVSAIRARRAWAFEVAAGT